jgi:hypothetical protein
MSAAILWMLVPLSWIDGNEIFSDPLALLLALLMLWACSQTFACGARVGYWLLCGALLAGLMLGTRLSYLALLMPLFYATWYHRRSWGHLRRIPLAPFLVLLAFALPVALWLSWQWSVEGRAFVQASQRHLEGHFSVWGGSITTDYSPVTRPARLLETAAIYGLGAWWPGTNWVRLPVTLFWLMLLGMGLHRLYTLPRRTPLMLAILWSVPYILWVGIGNDVDLARYTFPLIGIIGIIAALGINQRTTLPFIGLSLCLIAVTVPLAVAHRQEPPPEWQLAEFFSEHSELQTVVVLSQYQPVYVRASLPGITLLAPHLQVLDSQAQALQARGRDVYLLVWFPTASSALSERWVRVGHFCRSAILRSRGFHELLLYHYRPVAESVQFPLPRLTCESKSAT